VTIERGAYGQTEFLNDDGGGTDTIRVDLAVFAAADLPTDAGFPDDDAVAVAETTSVDDGFFEVELAAGAYVLCAIERESCSPAFDVADAPVRLDWTTSPAGDNWSDAE
jgi:hypothetical protein